MDILMHNDIKMDLERLDITELDTAVIITVDGDLEITTIKPFEQWIMDYGNKCEKDIVLDFSKVEYLDSSGIAVLIKLSRILKVKKKKLTLTKLSEKIKQILELSSLVDDLEQNKIEIV